MPAVWRLWPWHAATALVILVGTAYVPLREWEWARTWGELWFEIFDMHTNMTETDVAAFFQGEKTGTHYAICMHPHGILPIQGLLWAAFCNCYCRDPVTGRSMYGFGAVADVVLYLPVLRSLMGFLTCAGASYKTLKAGLLEGACASANAAGRRPKHMFILPGGIAEVFCSAPGKHQIVFEKRYGLIKLAIETGTSLVPTYVFGGTDFFHNLITDDSWVSRLSRKLRLAFTVFYGRFHLLVPYTPRVTMVFAEPLPVVHWDRASGAPVPQALLEDLHAQYMVAMRSLFLKYRDAAGYPDAELEIL